MIKFNCDAMDVTIDEYMLRVRLADGREIAAPLEYFPRLRDATPEQLARWEIIGNGTASIGRNLMKTSLFAAFCASTELSRVKSTYVQ